MYVMVNAALLTGLNTLGRHVLCNAFYVNDLYIHFMCVCRHSCSQPLGYRLWQVRYTKNDDIPVNVIKAEFSIFGSLVAKIIRRHIYLLSKEINQCDF